MVGLSVGEGAGRTGRFCSARACISKEHPASCFVWTGMSGIEIFQNGVRQLSPAPAAPEAQPGPKEGLPPHVEPKNVADLARSKVSYQEPNSVVRIGADGDVRVQQNNHMSTAGTSMHAALDPSLWGSAAASRITQDLPTNATSAGEAPPQNSFYEGFLMEKVQDQMGLYNWEPRYVVLTSAKKKKDVRAKAWKLPPGTVTPERPRGVAPFEEFPLRGTVRTVGVCNGQHKSRFEVTMHADASVASRSYLADSATDCRGWISAIEYVLGVPRPAVENHPHIAVNKMEEKEEAEAPIYKPRAAATSLRRTPDWAIHQIVDAVMNKRSLYGAVMAGLPAFFKAIDRNNDGVVSKVEFMEALKRLGLGLSEDTLESVCHAMCKPASEKIRYVDFLRTLKDVLKKTAANVPAPRPKRKTDEMPHGPPATMPVPAKPAVPRQSTKAPQKKKKKPDIQQQPLTSAAEKLRVAKRKTQELKAASREARIVARSIARKKAAEDKAMGRKRVKLKVRMPQSHILDTSAEQKAAPTAAKRKQVAPPHKPKPTKEVLLSRPVLSRNTSRVQRVYGLGRRDRRASAEAPNRSFASSARPIAATVAPRLSKSFAETAKPARKAKPVRTAKPVKNEPAPESRPPSNMVSAGAFAFQADLARVKVQLAETESLLRSERGKFANAKEAMAREREEFVKQLGIAQQVQGERDAYNTSSMEKMHAMYAEQLSQAKAAMDNQAEDLALAREETARLTIAQAGLTAAPPAPSAASAESVWADKFAQSEQEAMEARDNERMMKTQLIAANEALATAIDTNKDLTLKFARSEKLVNDLKQALKLSKEESKLLENERRRLTIENTELSNAIEKMDSLVYGRASHQQQSL